MKCYMEENGEMAWPLEEFEEGAILSEMKRDIGGEMWCDIEKDFLGECYEGCGNYNPCNGKSGRCRSLKNGFVETGRKFKKVDGKPILVGE